MPTTINPFNPVVGANDLTVTPLAPQEALPTDLQQLLSSADKAAPVPAPAKKEAEPEAPSDIQQLLKDSQVVPGETVAPSQPEPTAPAPTAPQEGETSRAEDDYKRQSDWSSGVTQNVPTASSRQVDDQEGISEPETAGVIEYKNELNRALQELQQQPVYNKLMTGQSVDEQESSFLRKAAKSFLATAYMNLPAAGMSYYGRQLNSQNLGQADQMTPEERRESARRVVNAYQVALAMEPEKAKDFSGHLANILGTVAGFVLPTPGAGLVGVGAKAAKKLLPTAARTLSQKMLQGAGIGLGAGAVYGAAEMPVVAPTDTAGDIAAQKAIQFIQTEAGFAAFGAGSAAAAHLLPKAFYRQYDWTPERFKKEFPRLVRRVAANRGKDSEVRLVQDVNGYLTKLKQSPAPYVKGKQGLDVQIEERRAWVDMVPVLRDVLRSGRLSNLRQAPYRSDQILPGAEGEAPIGGTKRGPVATGQAIPPAGAIDVAPKPAKVTLAPRTATTVTPDAIPRLIQAAKPDRQVVSQEIMLNPAVTALPESQRVAIANVLDDANIPLESLTPEGLEDLLQRAEPPPPAPPTAAERVKAITEDIKGRDDPELTAKMKSWKKKAKKEGWNDEVTAQGLEALVEPVEAPTPVKPTAEGKGEIIPNTKDLKIANLDQLARGTGARYLEVARGEDGALIAKQWRRKPIEDVILVDMEPAKEPIAPSPPTKPYIPVQGESLIPTKGAGEGALTFEVRYKTKDGKTGTTIIEAKDAQIASNEVQKQFDAEGTGETVTLAVKSETDMVDGIVESLEQAAQELPEFAPKAPSPYADIAAQIVSIIQNRPVIAAETDQNLAVESENKRIGETAKPRNIVTPAIPPNPVDVKASEIYNKNMAEQYRKKKVADLTLRQIGISDTVDVMGEIETTTGEHGVLDAGRGVDRGRHVQEKKKIAFLEGLERVAGSSMDDIYLLESDEVQKAAIQRYLETKEGREDINPHWLGIVDYLRDYMYEEIGPKVKYLRTKRYCVDGKIKGWTPEQEVLLAPLREAYLRTLEDGTTTNPNNAYTIARDEFLASPDSSILLHENYLPHNKTDAGGIDDADVFAHSLVKDYKDNRPPPTRSQSALQVREDNRPMDEIVDNPLIHLINHTSRTEVNYYLGEPLNALHAKLITGVYADGRLANKASIDAGKGVPIVSKYTQNYLQKWYANLMGMRPPPNVWETMLYRARGNLWKAIAFGVWIKEFPQRFFGGTNDPRYVKMHDLGTSKYVREQVDAEVKAMFPDDADRMLRDLDYDVLLGRMIARELGAQGKDQLNSFKEHGWRAAITVPAHIMTDNAFIHWLNRIPIVGGDQHCDLVVNSDALNRTTGWIEWVRKGKDFILDRNLNYEELKGPMRLNRLNDAERALFVKMLVSGQRLDALLYNAERQVTIANFRYDQKLSSFFEQSTVGRHLSQYSKWWRGLSSLVWRDWRSVTHQDWLSDDPIRQRVNGVKTFVTMAALYTMSNLIYRYFTGNWDEGEDKESTVENFWRNYRAQFRVGPYAPTILGNVNTLATPLNMLYRFEARGEMPAQVLESFKNLSSLTVGTTMNLTRAYLYRLEGMSSGDEKAYKKADELLWKTTKDAMKKGRSYFLQYSAISKWLFKIMDKYGAANPVGYPVDSGNWLRAGVDKILEKTGAPDWWKWYEPEEADEEAQWEKLAGVVFRLDKPKDKEEKVKPVVPIR